MSIAIICWMFFSFYAIANGQWVANGAESVRHTIRMNVRRECVPNDAASPAKMLTIEGLDTPTRRHNIDWLRFAAKAITGDCSPIYIRVDAIHLYSSVRCNLYANCAWTLRTFECCPAESSRLLSDFVCLDEIWAKHSVAVDCDWNGQLKEKSWSQNN